MSKEDSIYENHDRHDSFSCNIFADINKCLPLVVVAAGVVVVISVKDEKSTV